jgi:hypothetical protein
MVEGPWGRSTPEENAIFDFKALVFINASPEVQHIHQFIFYNMQNQTLTLNNNHYQ